MSDIAVNSSTGEVVGILKFDEVATSSKIVVVDPYVKLDNKDELVDVPFAVVDYKINHDKETDRDYGQWLIVDEKNNLWRVSDGSTGMFKQYPTIVEQNGGQVKNLVFANGLRKSEYLVDSDGNIVEPGTKGASHAATYYFA